MKVEHYVVNQQHEVVVARTADPKAPLYGGEARQVRDIILKSKIQSLSLSSEAN